MSAVISPARSARRRKGHPGPALRALLEALPAAAYTCDVDGLITWFNPQAIDVWGRTPRLLDPAERYCGSLRLFAVDGRPIPHADCWMALAIRENRAYPGSEIVVERPDGARRRVLAHVSPLRDDAGRVTGAVNVLADITELRRSEERLRVLLDGIADHFVQYDREWRYTFVNEKAAAVLGKPREALLGRSIWDLFPDAVGNDYYRRLHHAVATGEVVRFEHYYAPFDKWFDNHIYPTADGVSVFSTDITQRKRAEAELNRSREDLADFVNNAAEGMHWVDERGTILWANQSELEMLGYRREEYVGRPIADFHVDKDAIADMLRRLTSREVLRDYEARLRCKDGSIKSVAINSSARFDGDRFVHTRCFTRDITARHQAEEARARLAAIVESSHDAIVGKDLEGRVISWNAGAQRLYGYAAAEMVGQPATRLMPPERLDEESAILERVRRGERVANFETERLRKDGTPVPVSVTISPVRDSDGAIIGSSGVAHDISERKQAERAIQEREARYRSLVHASGAIVYTCDAEAHWLEAQPAWEAYTGQSFAEYRGHGWAAAIHPEDRPRITASVAAAVAAGTVWNDEGRLWHAPSRSYRYQEARSVPIRGPDGAVREWVGTCVDIHSRKTAEQALREADRRKEEFLAVLAHELRNPLAPIATSLQMLRMQGAGGAAAPMVEVMERQVHHLVRLVDDLLEISRITRGTIELRRDVFPLQDAVRGAVEISRDLVAAHAHELSVEMPAEPLLVDGDRVRLTQVVSNLLNNAAKYTPRGGHIRVRMEHTGGEVRVCIADTGIGIAPEQIERVFEMFAQTGRSIERATGGLGIGLSLARRLAELHGGTVEGRSDGEGRGSEFTVRLPVAAAARGAGSADAPGVAAGRRRHVLVVDDNRDAATTLVALLEALGHEARASFSGEEAMQLAATAPPDVMLLDLGMPDTDGYQVARRVRESAWGAGTRLVAITGWGQESDRRRTGAAGFDLHLVKPIALEELRRALS